MTAEVDYMNAGGGGELIEEDVTLTASFDTGYKATEITMFMCYVKNTTDWYTFGSLDNGTISNAINRIMTLSVNGSGNLVITTSSAVGTTARIVAWKI